MSPSEQISPRAVERVFQNAIFEVLDIRNKRTLEFNARLDQALRELRLRLTAAPQRFFVYAIALESIVLSDNDAIELTYRLRVRTVHLLANDIDSRRDLVTKLRDLYDIRSKIVHSGQYQVTDADLNLLRGITKTALIRISTRKEFLSMRSGKELGDWFQDRVLA